MFWKWTDIITFFHRDFDVIENKLIFCNGINILYCTLIKLVVKYGPYHVDSFEKKLMPITNFISEDIQKKLKIFCDGDRKHVFQFKMSTLMTGHFGKGQQRWKNIFCHNFSTNCHIDTNIKKKIYSSTAMR